MVLELSTLLPVAEVSCLICGSLQVVVGKNREAILVSLFEIYNERAKLSFFSMPANVFFS